MLSINIIIKDGKISCCEKCGLCIMGAASGVMAAVDFCMLIWVKLFY